MDADIRDKTRLSEVRLLKYLYSKSENQHDLSVEDESPTYTQK